MGFPEEYGGSKKPIALAQFILNVELELADAPIVGKNIGVIANTIYHEGSEEMKREFLPQIFANSASGRCRTRSRAREPTSPACSARRWTRAITSKSPARSSSSPQPISPTTTGWPCAPIRTTKGHTGISLLIVDVESEGISLSPMYCVGSTGAERTNEVVFDKVKVPKNHVSSVSSTRVSTT